MCGIVGLVNARSAADAAVIERAAALLHKRGPDDAGLWAEENAGFGHRRLSILDLSPAGHQPMVSADGRYVIVLNGEIYNFAALRKQIDPRESAWRSNSDTEVILAAYRLWGAGCVDRFHGMFAFAIWDRAEKSLFAARDRMGVKPFYYHHSAARFAFASRPRALDVLAPASGATLDEQALRFYLEIGYVPAPHSIHQDIRKLPPAHYLVLKNGNLTVTRYWDFRAIAPDESWAARGESDLLDELDEIVTRCVGLRMVSDVPLGAFLSGGIDSSLVVGVMKKLSGVPVKTFTIGFDEKNYDESAHAAAVARHLGTEHHHERMKVDDLLQLMPTFQEEFDEPFFDSSAFPTMAVSRLARQFVTVSLSGDGGDELFGGYHYYQIAHRMESFFRLPASLRNMAAALAGAVPSHRLNLLSAAMRQSSGGASFIFARSIGKDFGIPLNSDVLNRTRSLHELFAETALALPATLSAAETGMRYDALYTLPDDYLQKVDLGSMAFSLESRDPLLDQDLVEWGMKLPLAWKLRTGTNKYLLRKLAYRYVPHNLLDRPKQGFAVPIDAWLRGPLRDWALERLHDRTLFNDLPLDQQRALELFRLHESGARNVHPLLWAVLMLLDFQSRWRQRAVG
jgi:asparagine synthase (glutamine-hydrolysing)